MSELTKAGQERVSYNHLTNTYDTPDGTVVAAELVDGADSLADIFTISTIRESQRTAKKRNNVEVVK